MAVKPRNQMVALAEDTRKQPAVTGGKLNLPTLPAQNRLASTENTMNNNTAGEAIASPAATQKDTYYSRPELGKLTERLYNDAKNAEAGLQEMYDQCSTAQKELEEVQAGVESWQKQMSIVRTNYQKDPSAQNAQYLEKAQKYMWQLLKSYNEKKSAYESAYADFEPANRRYGQAVTAYNNYIQNQQDQLNAWKGTIRDTGTIQTDMDALDGEIKALEEEIGRLNTLTRFRNDALGEFMKQHMVQSQTKLDTLKNSREMLQEEYDWSRYSGLAELDDAAYFGTLSADDRLMELDLLELKSWEREDIAMLENYVRQSDDEFWQDKRDLMPTLNNARSNADALFQKYGENKVKEMAESYRRYQNIQNSQMMTQAAQQGANTHGGLHSILSVGANLLNSVGSPLGYMQEIGGRTGRYSTLDPNNVGSIFGQYAGTVRGQVAQNIAGDQYDADGNKTADGGILRQGLAELYGAGMSAADSLSRILLSGGNKFISLGLAATGSFGSTVSQMSAQGATPYQAITMGLIDGALEVLTEKYSIDNLFDMASSGKQNVKQILKNMLVQGAVEVTEEEASFLGSTLAEALVMREKSAYNQRIQELMNQGQTREQAKEIANRELWQEAGQTALQSFLSGSMMSGTTSAYSNTLYGLQEKAEKQFQEPKESMVLGEDEVEGLSLPTLGVSFETTDRVRQSVVDQAGRLARATGRDIVFYSADATENGIENGYYQDGKIYVNTRSENAVAQIVSHELTHSVEFADAYQDLSKVVFTRIQNMGADIQSLRQQKQALYAENGHALKDMTAVDQEIVAEFVEQYLLTDEQTILQVAAQNRSLGQRIVNWFDSLLAKLGNKNAQERTFLNNARNLWAKALEQTKKQASPAESRATQQTESNVYTPAAAQDISFDAVDYRDDGGTDTAYSDGAQETLEWARGEYSAGRMTEEEFDSLLEMVMQQEEMEGDASFSFAGVNAKNANFQTLGTAQELDRRGVANETIRQQTGWFKGMDGKWRWEIDDSKMQYSQRGDLSFRERNPGYVRYRELLDKSNRYALELSDEAPTESERSELKRLSEIWRGTFQKPGRITEDALPQDRLADYLQHDELFEAYPQLRKTTLRFANLPDGVRGRYDPSRGELTLQESLRRAPEDTLIHEIQHVIQEAEGFAAGSSTEFWDGQQVAKPEYAREIQKAEDTVKNVEARFRQEWTDDINLNLVKQYIELDNQLWGDETDPVVLQELADQMEQIEQVATESGWEDLFNDYYYAVGQLQMAKERARLHRRTSIDLYRNTAGEIEARDVAARRKLTAEERKNTPPMLGDEDTVFAEDTGISFDMELSEYPYNMQTVIQDYLDAVDQDVLSFIQEVQNGTAWPSKKVTVGRINTRMAEEITKLTGIETSEGNPIILNTGAVEHILKRHGAKGEADRSMRNNLDIARINYVLQNFDTAELSGKKSFGYRNRDGSPSQNVIFSKKINGTYFVIEAVPDTGKTGIVSAFINKKGASQVLDDNAPSSDVRNVPVSTPNESVAEGNDSVKQFSITATDKRGIANDLRRILSRGGSTAELRQYIDHLEQGGGISERTGGRTYQKGRFAERSESQRIIQEARRQGISAEEYLQQNWEQYEVDGEWNADARAALDQEQKGRRYSVSGTNEVERYLDEGTGKSIFRTGWLNQNQKMVEAVVRNRPQVKTDGFLKWFGSSKAKNTEGEPLLVFHGTKSRFTSFDTNGKPIWVSANPMYSRAYAGHISKAENLLPSSKIYARANERVIPVYIRAENPADFGNTDGNFEDHVSKIAKKLGIAVSELQNVWNRTGREVSLWKTINTPEMVSLLKNYGYDSIKAVEAGSNTWAVFEDTQVKSAVANNGKFDNSKKDIRYSISGTDEETGEKKTAQQIREEMPAKARNYLEGAERRLLKGLGEKLGVSKFQNREALQQIVREISDTYLEEGRMPDDKMDFLFDRGFAEGIIEDTRSYEENKEIKDHLRTVGVTLSKQDQSDIADYNDFRRRASGTVRIVNDGLPVDSAYHELHEMAPGLFPESITHPADQLVRMYEVGQSIRVAEVSLQHFYGPEAENHRKWAKNDFAEVINETLADLRTVKRVADEAAEKAAEMEAVPTTPEEAAEAYSQLKDARKTYEKAIAKNLLSNSDEIQVGRLLKGEILPEHLDPDKNNVRAITAVYEAKREYERITKLIAKYKKQVRMGRLQKADALLETANEWKDKKVGLAYSRETMERNVYDIVPDRTVAEQVNREIFHPVHISEAEATRFKNTYRDRVRALDLSRKLKKGNLVSEAHAVQLLGEAEDNIRVLQASKGRMKQRDGKTLEEWRSVIDEMWRQSPDLNEQKIRRAVAEFRKIYDELFQQMNEVRVRNGYEPVNYRQGYFPHFQPGDGDGVLSHFGKALGIDTQVAALPTTINGLTHTFRPGIQWFGNAQERLGFNTAYDAVEGFDKYIEGVASVIHQTDNIQMLRAMESQIRYRTTDEGIRKQVDAVNADSRLTEEEKRMKIDEIYKYGKYTLSNFVTELNEYTNLLANKKSRRDRTVESDIGRRIYTIMKNWESRVGANIIAGNISSALTNFIPLTQAGAQLDTSSMLKGIWNTLKAYKVDDGIPGMSTFLTNRRGSDPLVQTWAQTASEKLGMNFLMNLVDGFTSDTIVRAAYYQNLKNGLSEAEAMHQADLFAASVMADRSKGAMPTLFESTNPLLKMFTQFQLEVNNQFSEVFKDLPRRHKQKGLLVMVGVLFKYFLGAYLFNDLYEYFAGRRPALDPFGILNDTVGDLTGYELPNVVEWIGGEEVDFDTEKLGAGEAMKNLASTALGELPFSSGLTLLGVETDGGRIPASSAVPDLTALLDAATREGWSPEKRWKEAQDELNKLAYIIPPFGGNQIQKLWKGIKAYQEGGSYNVDAEGNDILQYPVYKDDPMEAFANALRMMVMGKNSLETAQDWVASGFDSLGAKQTAVYQDMMDAGATGRAAYGLLMELQDAEKSDDQSRLEVQRDILRNADVPEDAMAVAYYGLLASETDCEIMDSLSDMGANPAEVAKVLMGVSDAGKLKGAEASCAKRNAIAGSSLTDEEKAAIYREKVSDSRDDDIAQLQSAGLDFDEFLKVQNQYAIINEKDIKSSAKATELARWVDDQGYTEKQASVVKDCFAYYSQIPASANGYEKMVDAGLDPDEAYELADALDDLEPEEGENQVTNVQKWRECIKFSDNVGIQLAALRGVITDDNQYAKIQMAYDFGVTPDSYVSLQEIKAQFDADGNGSYTNDEMKAAVDSLPGNLSMEQKAVLWQLGTGNKSAKNNPYSREVGQKIVDARAAAKEGTK